MGILDRVLIPDFEPTPEHADPRTVWSAIGTPMIDPDGTSDAARSITIARPVARVVTREATARQLIADASEELKQAHIRDAAIMDALGLGTRRTTPWTNLRPADYVQLRVFLSEGLVLSARLSRPEHRHRRRPLRRARPRSGRLRTARPRRSPVLHPRVDRERADDQRTPRRHSQL